jgi:AraC-like DNA-binding protein
MVSDSFVGATEQIYSAWKIVPLVTHLEAFGIERSAALEGTGIPLAALTDPELHISRAQIIKAFENFMRLCADHISPLELGATFQLTDYGLYGYALFSSPTVGDALEFALAYRQLATPIVDMSLKKVGDQAAWIISVFPELSAHPEVVRFVTEYQTGILLALHRAIAGPLFHFTTSDFAYPVPPGSPVYQLVLQGKVRFHAARTELRFSSEWLDQRPLGANPLTFRIVEGICNQLISRIDDERGITGDLYRRLIARPGHFPRLTEMAAEMGLSARALRHAMAKSKLTYRGALDEVRFRLSAGYLQQTEMSPALIARRLGFAAPSTFVRSFKRWSGRTPDEFRSQPNARNGRAAGKAE